MDAACSGCGCARRRATVKRTRRWSRLVAKTLGVAARDVSLVAGTTARLKRLKVAGTATTLAAALEKICAKA